MIYSRKGVSRLHYAAQWLNKAVWRVIDDVAVSVRFHHRPARRDSGVIMLLLRDE